MCEILDRNNLPGLEMFRLKDNMPLDMLSKLFYRILESCNKSGLDKNDADKIQAVSDMKQCINIPYKYFDGHLKAYKKYGVEHPDTVFQICFYGMMDILSRYNYIGAFRDSIKPSDVPGVLSGIKYAKDGMIVLRGNMFDSSLSLYDMLSAIHMRCMKRYSCKVVCVRMDNWCFLFLE